MPIILNDSQQLAVRAHTAVELLRGQIIDWDDLGQMAKGYFIEIGRDNDLHKIYNFRTKAGKIQTLIHLKKAEEGWVATGGILIDTSDKLQEDYYYFRFIGNGVGMRATQVDEWHNSLRELLNSLDTEWENGLKEYSRRCNEAYRMWIRCNGWGEKPTV